MFNFEEIAEKRIFSAINNTNLSTIKILKESYNEVKNRIGKIPSMYDFRQQKSLDPEVIVSYADNYYALLRKMKEDIPALTDYEIAVLTMLSKEF